MADFNSAKQVDLTPQALAMIRLIQAGQSTVSDSRFIGRFGPGYPPMPVEPEAMPRLFQYQPGVNLMMIPRMGDGVLPFSTLRSMSKACKEIRLNIEHIKRTMRGVNWDIVPNDKRKTVVGGRTYIATPETESVKKFFKRPDGINNFEAWLNMVLEEVLVTDALTLWPVMESNQLTAVELIDGTTIKPLLDMRGGTPRPPMPAYLQIIWGTPQSSYPANTLFYRPLNTKVNTPYGESPIEWILTAINTAIRKDLAAVGYYAEGNIPGAFYTVPESWTPEQIETFQQYVDAIMAGDLARAGKLLAVPGGTGSHVTQFQQNDPDNVTMNEYLLKVACWAFGNNPAEFGLTGGDGLGGKGFMEGSENAQQRSMIGPVSQFLESIFTEITHDLLKRPDLRFSFVGLEPVEDEATQAGADQANITMGKYTVAYVQDRDAIPQEYRPAVSSSAPAQAGAGATLPMTMPPGYERYLKAAVDGDLKKWEEKQLRALKKGWGVVDFKSEVIPADMAAQIHADLTALHKAGDFSLDEYGIKGVFRDHAGDVLEELQKHYGPGNHKSGTPQSVHGGGGGKASENNLPKYKRGDIVETNETPKIPAMVQRARDEYEFQLAALERGGYLNMDGNKASPEEMRRIKANFRRSKQKLADIVNEYKADGYSIPDEFMVMKADDPEDLEKRDATERALAADLSAYFAGLADRITIAVSKADEVYLGKADKKKEDNGEDEGGEDEGPFKTDAQRRWFFAHLKDGENSPRSGNKNGPDKGSPDTKTKDSSVTGNKISSVIVSVSGPHTEKVNKTIYEIEKIHSIRSGLPKVVINGKAGRNQGQYRPADREIGVSSSSEHPMNTTAHEIAHYLDNHALGNGGYNFGSETNPEMQPLMSAISKSETMKKIRSGEFDYFIPEGESYKIKILNQNQRRYYTKKVEQFARAYAQYIAIKSNNPIMMDELRKDQKGRYTRFTVWPDEEFKPIYAEFDKLFKSKGWIK